jgi:hypothetical protein
MYGARLFEWWWMYRVRFMERPKSVWIRSTHDQEGGVRSGPLRISVKYKFTFAQEHHADKACAWKSGHCRVGMGTPSSPWSRQSYPTLRPNMSVGRLCLIKRVHWRDDRFERNH